jgi:hypothetical protein
MIACTTEKELAGSPEVLFSACEVFTLKNKENPASGAGFLLLRGHKQSGGGGRVIGPRLTTQFTSETHSPQKLFRKSKDQNTDLSCDGFRNVCLAADLFQYACAAAGRSRGAKAGKALQEQLRCLDRFPCGICVSLAKPGPLRPILRR